MAKAKQPWIDSFGERMSALGDALRRQGIDVGSGSPSAAAPAATPTTGGLLGRAKKIILRREKKGHGGKTVTIVEGLGLKPDQLEQLARDLRKAFGCGSSVAGADLVLQGDVVDRLRARLEQLGAMRIVIGS